MQRVRPLVGRPIQLHLLEEVCPSPQRDQRAILTKQTQATDAAEALKLLTAFRSIRDRGARLRVIEMAEAMAAENQAGREAADEHKS